MLQPELGRGTHGKESCLVPRGVFPPGERRHWSSGFQSVGEPRQPGRQPARPPGKRCRAALAALVVGSGALGKGSAGLNPPARPLLWVLMQPDDRRALPWRAGIGWVVWAAPPPAGLLLPHAPAGHGLKMAGGRCNDDAGPFSRAGSHVWGLKSVSPRGALCLFPLSWVCGGGGH